MSEFITSILTAITARVLTVLPLPVAIGILVLMFAIAFVIWLKRRA